MARRLTSDGEINSFISHVIKEANHHASNVAEVINPLSISVRQRLNLQSDRVEVFERNGRLARTCWVTINRRRYVFSYNYQVKKIELKDNSTRGAVRFQFDNNTEQAEITNQVEQL